MSIWMYSKNNNQRAQALTELATFGAVALFCLSLLLQYGLQMNYQQDLQMQAFRKAQRLAYYKQGPGSTTSFAVVEDKPIVDPRDQWGFADRVPMGSGASVTWGSDLNGIYAEEVNDTVDPRDYPRMYIEVDKSMRLEDGEINDNLEKSYIATQEEKGAFTAVDFVRKTCGTNTAFGIYLEDGGYQYGDKEYRMITRSANENEIKVYENEETLVKEAYYKYGGLKRQLISVDLKHNNNNPPTEFDPPHTVNIIAVEGTKSCDSDYYCGTLSAILYVDSSAGQINSRYTDVQPWDKDKKLEDKEGLLPDYDKILNYGRGSTFTVTETEKGISSEVVSDATQTITHKIKLSDGSVKEVEVKFQPMEYDWGEYEVSY